MSKFFAKPPDTGAIVYGCFPYSESPDSPAKEPHFCLVLASYEADDNPGQWWVIVAYGTSQNTGTLHAGEFLVEPGSPGGLIKRTKFCLARNKIAKMPYNDLWFSVPPDRRNTQTHPQIGVLDFARYQKQMFAAGNAVDIQDSVNELQSIEKGRLPL